MCAVHAVFYKFGQVILPEMQATSWEELANGSFCSIALPLMEARSGNQYMEVISAVADVPLQHVVFEEKLFCEVHSYVIFCIIPMKKVLLLS